MIQLNPQYEAIFDARNIDEDCNKIADEISDVVRMQIKELRMNICLYRLLQQRGLHERLLVEQ